MVLPAISLGRWHNFGSITPFGVQQGMLRTAFDNGITHFELVNNDGPPYGEAERNFGIHMFRDWKSHRDELFLSTKAGCDMWKGPYGDHGSRKYLMASIDQSLKRMNVDHVDVFYHHRSDPDTPIEETMGALDQIVRSGKALYGGISNDGPEQAAEAIRILRALGTPSLLHQPSYSMLSRWIENGLTDVLRDPVVTSALIGASRPEQIVDNIEAIHGVPFTQEELDRIEQVLSWSFRPLPRYKKTVLPCEGGTVLMFWLFFADQISSSPRISSVSIRKVSPCP